MNDLPIRFILSIKPKEYLAQGISNCGVYCVKAILGAYGKDDKAHPKDYHANWIGKNLFGFVIGKNYYDKIFASYGIISKTNTAENLSNQEKLNLLKTLLSKNAPVMIRIGNGYYKSNKYNPILGRLVPHWITLWGYDDKEKIFYVYDSGLTKNLYYGKTVPIGNTKRIYDEILRDWNFGRWQPWCWSTSMRNNLYESLASHIVSGNVNYLLTKRTALGIFLPGPIL